jgi:hypothetical protein
MFSRVTSRTPYGGACEVAPVRTEELRAAPGVSQAEGQDELAYTLPGCRSRAAKESLSPIPTFVRAENGFTGTFDTDAGELAGLDRGSPLGERAANGQGRGHSHGQ